MTPATSLATKSHDNESHDKVKNYWDFITINIKNSSSKFEPHKTFNIIFLSLYNTKEVYVVSSGEASLKMPTIRKIEKNEEEMFACYRPDSASVCYFRLLSNELSSNITFPWLWTVDVVKQKPIKLKILTQKFLQHQQLTTSQFLQHQQGLREATQLFLKPRFYIRKEAFNLGYG